MLFKNIRVFSLQEPFTDDAETLGDKLFDKLARPCGKTEPTTFGWVSPFGGDNEMLVNVCNGCFLFAACREERLLPTSVVRDQLQEKVEAIEKQESRKVFRKEKAALKEEIIFTLLPQAFTKQTLTYAYIDTKRHWLVIDAADQKKAEALANLLRDSLGSLKITPLLTQESPSNLMTQWVLQGHLPQHFCLEDRCEMQDVKTGQGIIRCQKQDLETKEIYAHLQSGKRVTQLALSWDDKLSFLFTDDFAIKSIRYLEMFKEAQDDILSETPEERLDADFALISGEFAGLLEQLIDVCGGLETAEAKKAA